MVALHVSHCLLGKPAGLNHDLAALQVLSRMVRTAVHMLDWPSSQVAQAGAGRLPWARLDLNRVLQAQPEEMGPVAISLSGHVAACWTGCLHSLLKRGAGPNSLPAQSGSRTRSRLWVSSDSTLAAGSTAQEAAAGGGSLSQVKPLCRRHRINRGTRCRLC